MSWTTRCSLEMKSSLAVAAPVAFDSASSYCPISLARQRPTHLVWRVAGALGELSEGDEIVGLDCGRFGRLRLLRRCLLLAVRDHARVRRLRVLEEDVLDRGRRRSARP